MSSWFRLVILLHLIKGGLSNQKNPQTSATLANQWTQPAIAETSIGAIALLLIVVVIVIVIIILLCCRKKTKTPIQPFSSNVQPTAPNAHPIRYPIHPTKDI